MSRSRSASVSTGKTRSRSGSLSTNAEPLYNDLKLKEPLAVRLLRIARPRLEFDQQSAAPGLPSLLSTQLLVPRTQQMAYVGEEFCGVVSIELVDEVDDSLVNVRVDVQTPDALRSELATLECDFSAQPRYEHAARLKLTQSGAWRLCVSARYAVGMIPQTLRRMFPIEAHRAIHVRTKISQSPRGQDSHVLEAQVENLTDTVMVVESCALIAENDWVATPLPGADTPHLNPKEVYQYCFRLQRGAAPEAGRLTVGWRREPLGVKGWQTTGIIRI